MQPGAPLAVALIVLAVVFDLQTRGQVAGPQDPHRDRQLLPVTSRARWYTLRVVVSAVGAGCTVSRALDRFHWLPSDTQAPETLKHRRFLVSFV